MCVGHAQLCASEECRQGGGRVRGGMTQKTLSGNFKYVDSLQCSGGGGGELGTLTRCPIAEIRVDENM